MDSQKVSFLYLSCQYPRRAYHVLPPSYLSKVAAQRRKFFGTLFYPQNSRAAPKNFSPQINLQNRGFTLLGRNTCFFFRAQHRYVFFLGRNIPLDAGCVFFFLGRNILWEGAKEFSATFWGIIGPLVRCCALKKNTYLCCALKIRNGGRFEPSLRNTLLPQRKPLLGQDFGSPEESLKRGGIQFWRTRAARARGREKNWEIKNAFLTP